MNGFLQDVRYALRQLRKDPGFAFTSVLILTLGMSASISIFGFVDAALVQPLPYANPQRLAYVTESAAVFPRANLSYFDYLDWKKLNHSFTSLDVYRDEGFLLANPAGAEPVQASRVSDGFFRTLGITPILGRDFHSGEDLPGAAPVVLLTYPNWQKRFGGRKDVVGQTVILSGVAYSIIGVLPRNFQFAPEGASEFWTTLDTTSSCEKSRGCHDLVGVARLKDGVTVEAARAEMRGIARQLELQYPAENRDQGAYVGLLSDEIVRDVRPILFVLLAGAGLLLLIACVNVSSLLLVRSESRKREIAVRGALGASRFRLIRQFTIEGCMLVATSAILSVFASRLAMQLLTGLLSKDILDYLPYLAGLAINLHVLAFAATISALSILLFSITPTLRLTWNQIKDGLSEGGRGYSGALWRRFGANLVAVELAIAVVLLVGAGLLGKSFYRLLHVDVGFQPDHLATLEIELSDAAYPKDEQQALAARKIVDRVSALPGVQSAGLTTTLPVSYNGNTVWIRIEGKPYNGEHNEVNQRDVTPAFFQTLHAKLLRGRYFTDFDDASKPHVLLINEALAKRYFPGEDPIGKKIGDTELSPKSLFEVVGVVEDVHDGALDQPVWPAIYRPFAQNSSTFFSLVVRTTQSEAFILPSLVSAIHQVDPGIGTQHEMTMLARMSASPTAYMHRSSAWLVGGFAGMALLLSIVGLYGVVAYSVSRRTREIGVRMALGAQRSSVYRMIMTEAARLSGMGIAVGVVLSILAALLMRGVLFGVRSWDVPTLAGVSVVLGTAALLASYLPARKAAQVDPSVALRYE